MRKLFLLLFISILLTGCGVMKDSIECSDGFYLSEGICIEEKSNIGTFTSSDEIFKLFESFNEKQETINHFFGRNLLVADVLEATPTAEATDDYTSNDTKDYSGTNNQVEGVDEMDNVLTDGDYIYVQNYNEISIVKANEDDVTLVKKILYDDLQGDRSYFYFNGMYVDGDRLIVVGNSYYNSCLGEEVYQSEDGETKESSCRYYEYHTVTRVLEYEKENFTLINEYELSGNYIGSRKIGDDLYFVTNEYIPFYMMNYDDYEFDLDSYLPNYTINDKTITLGYDSIIYVDGTNPTTYTSFFGISLDTNEVSTEIVLGEGGYNLYVSKNNVYLTNTKWNWNNDVYLEIEAAVDDEEQDYEPEEDPYEITTSILKISIDEGKVQYANSGEVKGQALNQFSMDEYNGNVRIVTTTNNWWRWWNTESEVKNRLFILDEDLNEISMLDGLGKPGESVQSTRFVGDYAYVVTFLNTDPFYVIDVSDPENPEKLSELEIPGFSSYLQPLNENFILGIGFGDMDGGTSGLKISLYDVTDKSNAVEVSKVIYPYLDNKYIWSSATYNHKDLMVSLSKGIITLPYTAYDWMSTEWNYQSGVIVLNVDLETGELSERAKVLHSSNQYNDAYVYKAKYIDDYLYTISSKYVKVSTIENPEVILDTVTIGTSREVYYEGEVLID